MTESWHCHQMPGRVTGRTDCLRNLNTGLADLGFSPAQSQMCLLEMGMSETLTPEEPCFSLLSLTRDSSRIHEPLGFCTSQYVICKAAQMCDITEDLCSILCSTWHGTLLEQIFLRACALICKRGKCWAFFRVLCSSKKCQCKGISIPPCPGNGIPCSHQPMEPVQSTCSCPALYAAVL